MATDWKEYNKQQDYNRAKNWTGFGKAPNDGGYYAEQEAIKIAKQEAERRARIEAIKRAEKETRANETEYTKRNNQYARNNQYPKTVQKSKNGSQTQDQLMQMKLIEKILNSYRKS